MSNTLLNGMSETEMVNKHYICGGECIGVFEEPGVCKDPNCSLSGRPLVECTCGDAAIHTEAGVVEDEEKTVE